MKIAIVKNGFYAAGKNDLEQEIVEQRVLHWVHKGGLVCGQTEELRRARTAKTVREVTCANCLNRGRDMPLDEMFELRRHKIMIRSDTSVRMAGWLPDDLPDRDRDRFTIGYAQLVGAAIRAHRIRAPLTPEDFAAAVGLSQPSVSKIESGRVAPTVTQLRRFGAVLGVSVSDLIVPADYGAALLLDRGASIADGPYQPGFMTWEVVIKDHARAVRCHRMMQKEFPSERFEPLAACPLGFPPLSDLRHPSGVAGAI